MSSPTQTPTPTTDVPDFGSDRGMMVLMLIIAVLSMGGLFLAGA